MVDSKLCGSCNQVKSSNHFGVNRTKSDGLQSHCKACRKIKTPHRLTPKPRSIKVVNPLPVELVKMWDEDRNVLSSSEVNRGAGFKAYWKCDQGHKWKRKVSLQQFYCSECEKLKKRQNLLSIHPYLVEEWDEEKNIGETIATVPSTRKVSWKCSQGHGWLATLSSRSAGAGCAKCAQVKATGSFKTPSVSIGSFPLLVKEWSTNNPVSPEKISVGSDFQAEWVCSKCSHVWHTRVGDRVRREYGCPVCSNRQSKPELELQNFVSEKIFTIKNSRQIIAPFELDIYVPEKKIAVEFNGLYWHDENHKPQNYHYDKWLACKKQGIQLIQIWEDDWNRNPELVKRMITYKLGLSTDKIGARQTSLVDNVDIDEVNLFLTENHIQGFSTAGSIKVGLTLANSLVAVAVFKQEPFSGKGSLNLLRFATSVPVVGGFTKILKHIEKIHPVSQIITFSDNTISDGGLYEKNGFKVIKQLPPDYMYVVNGIRQHKFGYRLKKFRNDPTLQYKEGLSERELALLNNFPRIWDAGKTKWVKNYSI